MKQKVGILTTYFASNFGAMLQPFALKRHIEDLGYDVEMIRYEQKAIYSYYNPWKPQIFKSGNIRTILSYLWYLPRMLKRDHTFNKFMWKHINSEKGFCERIPSDKDFYFIGSDQIWNPKSTRGFDNIYFGKFPVKEGAVKASYAASAENIQYNERQIAYLKENIFNFDYVSVREKELEINIRKITGREDIVTVLDPTMLVNPLIYEELKHIHPCQGNKFVFFYNMRNCNHFMDKIYAYSQSISAKMVIVSDMLYSYLYNYERTHSDVIYLPLAGIELFLGGMKFAECVFTPSFHGSVFTILNHRKFYTLNLQDDKMTRPTHLLTMLGISDRLLAIEDEITDAEIDYSKVDKLLDKQREYSRNFILKVLNKE